MSFRHLSYIFRLFVINFSLRGCFLVSNDPFERTIPYFSGTLAAPEIQLARLYDSPLCLCLLLLQDFCPFDFQPVRALVCFPRYSKGAFPVLSCRPFWVYKWVPSLLTSRDANEKSASLPVRGLSFWKLRRAPLSSVELRLLAGLLGGGCSLFITSARGPFKSQSSFSLPLTS